jgi:hypothetical protein
LSVEMISPEQNFSSGFSSGRSPLSFKQNPHKNKQYFT